MQRGSEIVPEAVYFHTILLGYMYMYTCTFTYTCKMFVLSSISEVQLLHYMYMHVHVHVRYKHHVLCMYLMEAAASLASQVGFSSTITGHIWQKVSQSTLISTELKISYILCLITFEWPELGSNR